MKIKETLAQLMLQVRSVMGKLTPTQRLSLGLLAGVVVVTSGSRPATNDCQ